MVWPSASLMTIGSMRSEASVWNPFLSPKVTVITSGDTYCPAGIVSTGLTIEAPSRNVYSVLLAWLYSSTREGSMPTLTERSRGAGFVRRTGLSARGSLMSIRNSPLALYSSRANVELG